MVTLEMIGIEILVRRAAALRFVKLPEVTDMVKQVSAEGQHGVCSFQNGCGRLASQ